MSEVNGSRANTYSVGQAARVLGLSESRVRQMAAEGELESERVGRGYRIPQQVVHEMRQSRRDPGEQEANAEVSELRTRIEELTLELGKAQGRTELTEWTHSTLNERHERETERNLVELERLRKENERLRREANRSFWEKLFGGSSNPSRS